jgi:hypothetical protein
VDRVGALLKKDIQKKIKPNARQLPFVFDVMIFFGKKNPQYNILPTLR